MRDQGLDEAIRAAGGVSELARRIGISQPSVSNWDRIPAERVIAVEQATNVEPCGAAPGSLRRSDAAAAEIDETDLARAQEYRLLAALLARAPDASFLKKLSMLRGDASPLGLAHVALAEAASAAKVESVEREFFNVFIGVGRGELLPYGSYYLTGFLHERPLARLRDDLNALGIERSDGNAEPEDNAATAVRDHGRTCGRNVSRRRPGADKRIFENHLAPWIGRFFADLERAEEADFYRKVGTLGRAVR